MKNTHKLAVIFQQEKNKKILTHNIALFLYQVRNRETGWHVHTHTLRKCWKGQTLWATDNEPARVEWLYLQYLQCRVFVTSSTWKLPCSQIGSQTQECEMRTDLDPQNTFFGVCSNCFLTWILYWKTLWYRPRFLFCLVLQDKCYWLKSQYDRLYEVHNKYLDGYLLLFYIPV